MLTIIGYDWNILFVKHAIYFIPRVLTKWLTWQLWAARDLPEVIAAGVSIHLRQWYIILHIHPYFHKIYKFPLFPQNLHISPIFVQFTFFAFPYFDHGAFTHHALQVLDAPEWLKQNIWFLRNQKGRSGLCFRLLEGGTGYGFMKGETSAWNGNPEG